jgi:hypothetical protein
MAFTLSDHALEEIERRNISREQVESVLQYPQQVVEVKAGRKAYQSQIDFGSGKIYLLRVIVDENTEPAVVVTVNRTSKISEYWSEP